ncbi:adenomatous polyposis coli protein 2 isoform X1 [Hypomesus transpacificus]|uniref:adenomatous polyposis coli protein 2 isoform X1 n=1 Tax=Hypomesus transpacificus TaxID=137520 RepID=UPI001F07AE97|nr:adenomatous polyposis coli protein 2 isoform X1 [Hypomesus transpacificus]
MANSVASYDQLAHQVEALRKENFHLRKELEDNSNHLSKLENETSDMKDILRQLQSKLEQEAGTLASSGRADVLDQLKELHMDLTNYYELKHQPHNLHVLSDTLSCLTKQSDGDIETTLSSRLERTKSLLRPLALQSSNLSGNDTIMHPGHPHILEGAPPKRAAIGGEYHITAQYLEELCKERTMLLSEIDKEERERCWYYTQLKGLSQRLAELPCIDTFSLQMDLIRQQLEFEAQQLRSVMVERFGTSDEMVHRTQIRVARLEQLEKKLQEAQECQSPQDNGLCEPQIFNCEKTSNPETENASSAFALEASGDRGSKVEMVFWLLSMLANRDKEEMTRTLLAMSSSQDSCIAMRKSGCVPLLVQILHNIPGATEEALRGAGCNREVKSRASAALHNIIYSQPDEGQARREMRVLHLLEQICSHCDSGWDWMESHVGKLSPGGTKTTDIPEPLDPLICQAMCGIMKLSFEEEYRRAMNELGGLQVVAELMYLDQEMYGMQNDPLNMALRRYAGMALTNLTFGDVVNKATLCSKKDCLQAIVAQLASDSEELHQVVSSILRNLSWRADINSKMVLRDIGSVSGLITCALQATKESTLKSLLSALWNLSAHSIENKVSICSVDGALGFLVSTLTYRCQTNSLAIIESGGGILRNVSSLVATREDYRQILRDHNCLQTLLQHLRSHSLTIVSNACGTLWNLSAQSAKDQELLWDMGAVSMLRNLIHSKHKMIAMGSAAALKNIITNRPLKYKDAAVISPGSCMPSLYMRKQKALEAELDAKNLTETFDSLEKLSPKHLSIKKPLRHIESLAKDYASDSGCFDDDEAPNVCGSLDTGSFSMLSMFLSNSNLLQNQPCKKDNEPEREVVLLQTMENGPTFTDDVSAAAEKLAKKITNTVAKIDKLVEDITMHTSSEDSFSISSEDHFADWPYGSGELHEARAKSCSPFHFSDTSSLAHKDQLSRAHALLRLKTAHISLSTDSLNSGSTSDGYCGSKDQIQPSSKVVAKQSRPNKLDLKLAHQEYLGDALVLHETNQTEVPRRDSINGEVKLPESNSTETEKYQELHPQTPASVSTKLSSDVSMTSVKLSPSYNHVPLIQSVNKLGIAKTSISAQDAQAMRRQAWVPTVMTGGSILKCSPMSTAKSPILGPMETLQKYSVENTPICFSRCSSLSSLSSGDGALDGHSQSEYELESELSLEIIEVDDTEVLNREEENETKDDLRCDKQLLVTDSRTNRSDPIEIPCTVKHEKIFLRAGSPSILEDRSPSSSSENYIQETPLVMSRCSSVSSLGSFESPSIASSILSDQCSEMISGTLSPSDLPDSPGQTMPPSRSKTPCCVESSGPDTQTTVIAGQWESSLCKFMEIADFKERFNIPPDLDTMIYFTVEKPTENFSCASSLSALPLHEHYIQKDVELKLTPLQQQKENDFAFPDDKEHSSVMDQGGRYSEGNSDEDTEILKECINSAMPSKFRKVRPSLMSTLPTHVLNCQSRKPIHVPMYMMLPNNGKQMCTKVVMPQKDNQLDDSSFTDSAEGTPINLSSTTSLSDETLQYPVRNTGSKDWPVRNSTKQELLNDEAKRIEDLRIFSHFHKPSKITSRHDMLVGTMSRSIKHVIPTQKVLMQSKEVTDRVVNQRNCDQASYEQRQKLALTRKLELPVKKQNTEANQNQRAPQRHVASEPICHITPTEGAIYCFYDEEREKKQGNTKTTERQLNKESNRDIVSRSMTNISRIDNTQIRHKVVNKVRQTLIRDDTPLCYSLSSSLSSLSDADLKDRKSKSLKVLGKNKHNQASNKVQQTKTMHVYDRYGGHSSPSSVSMDSEDDLLQKCITSAMPKQKKKLSARKKNLKKRNPQKVSDGWNIEQGCDSDDTASDIDSDLNSVEWRAIQEGANSVVNRLQASKSQEHSSEESESVLSFMSGSSFTPKEKKFYVDKKANKPLDFAPRKPVPNMPMVFRGRTVIYTPKKEIALSQRPLPMKVSIKSDAPKNPNLAQHRSKSLHRLGKPQEIELSLPKRSSTPPPRIPKSSSSGSSQSSTPSRESQRKLTSPSQSTKAIPQKSATPASISSERKGRSLVCSNQSLKSQAHKTQKSPVRITFMQNSTRQSRTVSPLVTNQPTNINRPHTQVPEKKTVPANRYDFVRMTSVQSNSSESDQNGLLRQLTFIKESKTLLKRSGSSPCSMATTQQASSMRTCPGGSAVFLCSSRCQELKAVVQAPRIMQGKCHEPKQQDKGETVSLTRTTSSEHNLHARRLSRRTSSESPCRVPKRNGSGRVSGDKQQEKDTFKRYSSSPSINILSRVTSRSSLRSLSSDSSGRTKSEDDTKKRQQRTGTHLNDKLTWRRIRDEDVPQILKNTLPQTALPLFVSAEQPKGNQPALPCKLPTILLKSRETSDATVQTEDLLTNKTHSSTSPTTDTALVFSEEAARLALLRKIGIASGGNLQDGDFDCSINSYSTASTANSHPVESHTGGVVRFRQSSPSKAVRVTPFNYIPSPMGCCLQDKQSQSFTINKNSNENTEA